MKKYKRTVPLARKHLAVFAVNAAEGIVQSVDCFQVEKRRPRVFDVRDEPAVEMLRDHGEERFASGREAIEVRADSNASPRSQDGMGRFGVHVPEVV